MVIATLSYLANAQLNAYSEERPDLALAHLPEGETMRAATPTEAVLTNTFIVGMALGRRYPDIAAKINNIFERAFATPLNGPNVTPEHYEIQTMRALEAIQAIMESSSL